MIAVIEDARRAKGTALILVVDDDPAMQGGLRFTSPTLLDFTHWAEETKDAISGIMRKVDNLSNHWHAGKSSSRLVSTSFTGSCHTGNGLPGGESLHPCSMHYFYSCDDAGLYAYPTPP